MLVQFHFIQTYPANRINRDRNGAIKSLTFGGVKRTRQSSQTHKRAVRHSETFAELGAEAVAIRTRLAAGIIRERLEQRGDVSADVIERTVAAFLNIGRDEEKKAKGDNMTNMSVFAGLSELHSIADRLAEMWHKDPAGFLMSKPKKGEESKPLTSLDGVLESVSRSVDIAMFGRMTTSDVFIDADAAVQMAHAIGIHEQNRQYDWFTTVDDRGESGTETGVSMIGETEFGSDTMYRYANVHVEQLVENLGGDKDLAVDTIVALLRSLIVTTPGSGQNSFASSTLPDLVLVEVSTSNAPLSYANAYVAPIRSRGEQLLQDAAQRLFDHALRADKMSGIERHRCYVTMHDIKTDSVVAVDSTVELCRWLRGELDA